MPCLSCATTYLGSRPGAFAALSRAAAKSASATLRAMRVLPVRVDWPARAAACERCPMRVVSGGTTYCGTPFLRKPSREPATDGCGCPTVAKAKDPAEHCPLNKSHQPTSNADTPTCDCKWCRP
jgi:hypothetical protein